MTFLPQGYSIPSESKYMRLQQGENTFRILSSAITGYEYWNQDNKPIRSRQPFQDIPKDIKRDPTGKPVAMKHFWAFVIWNHDLHKIQIYEVTQASIQIAIGTLAASDKWGDPRKYDITITRQGEKLDTKYAVFPAPPTPISQEILRKAKATPIRLEALYDGRDPFDGASETHSEPTPAQEIKQKVKAAGWDRKLSNEIDIGQEMQQTAPVQEEQIDISTIPFN